jgi:multiple sugar transport system permease protein
MDFVGLDNFIFVLKQDLFWQSLGQSFQFVGITLVLQITLGLGIALLVNDKTRSSSFMQVLVLLPWAVPPIVNGILWEFLFNARFGYINVVLTKLGLIDEFVIWVQNPQLALYAVTAAFTWRTIPFAVILLLAALQSIPEDLYEVAAVDGANAWHRFRHITLPLIQPAIMVVLILRTMWSFMAFDEILAITQGGPGYETWVASWYTYATAFRYLKFGVGAASAYILGLVIAVLALIYIKFLYVEIEY